MYFFTSPIASAMYQLTVARLQIFLGITTWLEHDFMSLVAKIATGGFYTLNASALKFWKNDKE